MQAKGRAFKYGDNVDTDVIIPARYLNATQGEELAKHCMEDIDKEFIHKVKNGDIIVAEKNFGCGSSREHAPVALKAAGVSCVIAKSFARIHETNLKKQGVLALTFKDPADYDRIREGDIFRVACAGIKPGEDITLTTRHTDGTTEEITARHTYNEQQLRWLRAGSALNAE